MDHDNFKEFSSEPPTPETAAGTEERVKISPEEVQVILDNLKEAMDIAEKLQRTAERAVVYGSTNHGRPERAAWDEDEIAQRLRAALEILEKNKQD